MKNTRDFYALTKKSLESCGNCKRIKITEYILASITNIIMFLIILWFTTENEWGIWGAVGLLFFVPFFRSSGSKMKVSE